MSNEMFNKQKTVRKKVSCTGVGLHSGLDTKLTIHPAKVDEGIIFKRTDVQNEETAYIKAEYQNVSNTLLGTTITNEHGTHIATIEHLMAALWGCGIDNCIVELDAPEIPIMDGSSEPFVFLIECAGHKLQSKNRKVIEILKEVSVYENKDDKDGAFISMFPSEDFSINLDINFNDTVISKQSRFFKSKNVSFKGDLCRARTFCFASEVDMMRKNGLARGGSLDNAIVVDKDGILNNDPLRYADEFVRHKILDCIGDIFLSGAYLKAHIKGSKSGHGLNNKLLRKLFSDSSAWRYIYASSEENDCNPIINPNNSNSSSLEVNSIAIGY